MELVEQYRAVLANDEAGRLNSIGGYICKRAKMIGSGNKGVMPGFETDLIDC